MHGSWTNPRARRPSGLWQMCEDHGLTLVSVAEAVGGAGGSLHDAAVVLDTAARFAAPLPLAESLCAGWLHEQIEASVPAGPLAAELAAPTALLERAGTGWHLRAQVPRVPFGRLATRLLVLLPRDGQLAVVCVDPSRAGVTPGRNLANEPRDDLDLDIDVDADDVTLLPAEVADDHRLLQALTKAIQLAGAADQVSGMTVRYAKEREQFGRPIAAFQAVQHQLAELAGEVAVMRAASAAAVDAWVVHGPSSPRTELAVAAAKTQTSRSATLVAAIAHQVHGAMGFTREHRLRLLTTRLWSWSDEVGDESYWARYLGDRVLALDPADVWNLVEGT